jgi:hypothetical protein
MNARASALFIAILILAAQCVSAWVVDPASTGFGGKNRTENIKNLTQNWRLQPNATVIDGTLADGSPIVVVPWFNRGDQCQMTSGSNGLHGAPCTVTTLNTTDFCGVTDETSQVALSDSLSSQNGTRMQAWVNTIQQLQGIAGSALTEWTYRVQKNGSNWVFYTDQVSDSASDADAHFIVAMAAVNNSGYANSSTRAEAGALLDDMCASFADENFLGGVSITNTVSGGTLSKLPCGGTDVCTAATNNDLTYTAYNGPILEALAACNAKRGDNSTHNYTLLADQTVQAHLVASNWTGTSFSVGCGRSYKWSASSGSAYCICTNSCSPAPYTDDPDGMRAPRICNGGYAWELRNVTLRNLSTYCEQWNALSGETSTAHVLERYFNGTAKSASGGGYKEVGIGAFMNSVVNTSWAETRINQYNTHYYATSGYYTMDSQACFGVYDKAFGIMSTAYLVGVADSAFTTSSGESPAQGQSTNTLVFAGTLRLIGTVIFNG